MTMANEKTTIDELILLVPGLGEQEAPGIGREIARVVTARLPSQQRDRHLGALNLNVSVPARTSRVQMASLVSEAILKGLV